MEFTNEVGRELKGTELKRRTVVVIEIPHTSELITMWISAIDVVRHEIRFYSGTLGWVIINRYDQDGVVYDGKGQVIHVYEYLGEV